ncbi:MAG: DEAD/DEAH box helicase [Bacteroidetes bacterium]|nr:DEAD/DEAH box helicase [Bacteroidota bacterium]
MEKGKGESSRYTAVVDLTSRAVEASRREKGLANFKMADARREAGVEDLGPALQNAVRAAGWTSLTEVQRKAIPLMVSGEDLVVQSKTGSGKTGAFLLPLFERIDTEIKGCQVLILAPTRELARQIHAEYERMRPQKPEWDAALVYGGVRYEKQTRSLKGGAPVVIGTPGRVLDHLEQRTFDLKHLNTFVLDEADEMLSMGFYPAMKTLKRYLPEKRSSYMFSATMPMKVQHLAKEFLNDPILLALSAGDETVDTMEHFYYVVNQMDKDRALVRLFEMENPDSAIIFANTKRDVEYLTQFLQNYGHDADGLSGDLTQSMREKVMARIRDQTLRFLVATDVAARGIDITDLSHVIMFDVPKDPEYYLHRSGRTARAGKSGTVLVLATIEDERLLQAIAKRYDVDLEKKNLPTQEDVNKKVSERITVLLEQEYRDTRNLEKERLRRFVALTEQIADEEPELLALLLDRFYHEKLHARPDTDQEQPEAATPAGPKDADSGRKRRSGNRRGRERGR